MAAEKFRITLVSILISLAGTFHFGYQLTSVNPTESVFRRFINGSYFVHYNAYLEDQQYRIIWSAILTLSIVGDICGAPCLVIIAEKLGRKRGLYLSTLVMLLSFLMVAASKWFNSFEMFAAARFFTGLGEGWTVGIQTMYLSECSPKRWRGLCGGISGVFVELGLIAGSVVTLPEVFGTDQLWPFVYIAEAFLIAIVWFAMPFIKESPKYLVAKGRREEARQSLRYFQHENVEDSLRDIIKEVSCHEDRTSLVQLFRQPHLRQGLFLGGLVWLISTFSGIEALDFFSTRLFTDVGLSEHAARYTTIGLSCQAFLAALASSFILDRVGRRPLLLLTAVGLAIANALFMLLTMLYLKYYHTWLGYACVIVQFLWISLFGIGPAVLQWTIAAEVMPQNARATALALINVVNLTISMATRLAFFPLHGLIGVYSFLIYVGPLCVFSVFVFLNFPETKNRSVVDIMHDLGYKVSKSDGEAIQLDEASMDHKESMIKGVSTT